jgi:hypothetical protein
LGRVATSITEMQPDSENQDNGFVTPIAASASRQEITSNKRAYSIISNEKRILTMNAIDSLGMSVTEASKHF